MGLLDDPSVAWLTSEVSVSISEAESAAGVQLTPIGREIVALFVVAPAFEAPGRLPQREVDQDGLRVTRAISDLLPSILSSMRESSPSVESRGGLIATVDIYHWLTQEASAQLRQLSWPYPKD